MEDGVRVLRADLHREISVTASRFEPVPGEARHPGEAGRPRPLQPETPVEQRGAHPDGDRQPVLRAPHRRHVRILRGDPGGEDTGPHGQLPQERRQLLPVPCEHVEGHETAEPLLRGQDPRLVRAVERHQALVGSRRGDAGSRSRRHRADQSRASHDTRGTPYESSSAETRVSALVTFRHGRSLFARRTGCSVPLTSTAPSTSSAPLPPCGVVRLGREAERRGVRPLIG